MDYFNSNRFRIDSRFERQCDKLLKCLSIAGQDGTIDIQKTVKKDERASAKGRNIFYHVSGTGKLQFNAETVSAGMLKLTGNLPAFYKELSPMIDSNDAMILTMTTVAEDGWLAAKSVVVTKTSMEEFDLVGTAIKTASKMLNNDRYTTDTHKFE